MEINNSPDIEEKIYIENENLIHTVLKRYKNDIKYLTYDDLFQEGSIGLLKAIRTFNSDKGAFSTYAIICIKNEIRNYVMRNKFGGVKVCKQEQYNAIKAGKDAVEDLVKKFSTQLCGDRNFPEGWLRTSRQYPSAEDEALTRIAIDAAIDKVGYEKHRAILRRFFETMNAIQTAQEFGVNKRTVYYAINKFIENYYIDG